MWKGKGSYAESGVKFTICRSRQERNDDGLLCRSYKWLPLCCTPVFMVLFLHYWDILVNEVPKKLQFKETEKIKLQFQHEILFILLDASFYNIQILLNTNHYYFNYNLPVTINISKLKWLYLFSILKSIFNDLARIWKIRHF